MDLSAPVLDVQRVCFAYSGADVLHDISLTVGFGETVAIAGPNGSGKSTLAELIAGVRKPRLGAIERRGHLALVVQRPRVPDTLPVTAADVVEMGTWGRGRRMRRPATRGAVTDALERVGMLAHRAVPLAELSGGQRQRVFLAQGLVGAPDVLVLDEPAAGLDADSVQRMRGILTEEARRGAAVVCVTHDGDAAAAADRVLRLESGVRVA